MELLACATTTNASELLTRAKVEASSALTRRSLPLMASTEDETKPEPGATSTNSTPPASARDPGPVGAAPEPVVAGTVKRKRSMPDAESEVERVAAFDVAVDAVTPNGPSAPGNMTRRRLFEPEADEQETEERLGRVASTTQLVMPAELTTSSSNGAESEDTE